jgi:hypothetical protein
MHGSGLPQREIDDYCRDGASCDGPHPQNVHPSESEKDLRMVCGWREPGRIHIFSKLSGGTCLKLYIHIGNVLRKQACRSRLAVSYVKMTRQIHCRSQWMVTLPTHLKKQHQPVKHPRMYIPTSAPIRR